MDDAPHQSSRVPTSGDMSPQGFQDPNQGPGYEFDNVKFRGILIFGAGLTLLTALIMFGTARVMDVFAFDQNRRAEQHPEQYGITIGQFPLPKLQEHDAEDMRTFYAEERKTLDGYGWADDKHQTAHLPVSRAIDLLVDGGPNSLKAKPAVPAPADSPPSEASPAPAPAPVPEATPAPAPALDAAPTPTPKPSS